MIPTTQSELELMYSKFQLIPRLRMELTQAGFNAELAAQEIPVAFGIDLMAQLILHKRASLQILIGILWHHFEDCDDPFQTCADMIKKAAEKDFIDHTEIMQTTTAADGAVIRQLTPVFVMKYDITDDVKAQLAIFQYPLPMIEEPLEVRNNRETGYLTIRNSLVLKDNHTEDDICLDHINRCNQIPLALNGQVVAFVQNKWKSYDKRKVGESSEDFAKRKKAFQKYNETAKDVLQALMLQGDRFWLTHKYDKRGRTYAQGYHTNYQGNDWNKACIEFADKEMLDD